VNVKLSVSLGRTICRDKKSALEASKLTITPPKQFSVDFFYIILIFSEGISSSLWKNGVELEIRR
jgi:hypothetical protein